MPTRRSRREAADWDRNHTFPSELFAELGELGLMGVCVPAEHGGAGADFLAYMLVLEELSRGDAGVGVTVAVHTSACTLPLLDHGSPYVEALASGEELGAFALTEAGSGSDASAMRTRYADGAITGAKQWITNGSYASTILVFAREDERISAFIVRAGADGFAVTREEEKLGLNSSSTADLVFEDTPAERLGEPGKGMSIALRTLDGGRIGIAAQAVGIAQAAFELATNYAKERHAFGGPIARLGAIQQKLADMQTEIEAARALVWRAARLKDAGRPHTVEGAQAKLFASRVARHWTGEAIQILGGYGYTKEFPAERYYRDAKVTEIYEGTSEIQRLVIARALLGEAMRGWHDDALPFEDDRGLRGVARRAPRRRPTASGSSSRRRPAGSRIVTYDEALEVALAYGWIDGQAKRIDDDWYLQRFTPRRARSHVVEDQPRARREALIDARRDAAGRPRRGRAREGRRPLGRAPTTRRRPRRCPTTCAPRSTPTRPPRSSSPSSTASTATRSCTASRAPSGRRRARGGSSSSSTMCSRGETVHPRRRALGRLRRRARRSR